MESTGSTTSKTDKKENTLKQDHWRFLPAVAE